MSLTKLTAIFHTFSDPHTTKYSVTMRGRRSAHTYMRREDCVYDAIGINYTPRSLWSYVGLNEMVYTKKSISEDI